MITKILHFLQVLEILGKWICKAVKNYHITASLIFITNLLTKTPNNHLLSATDMILIFLIVFGYRQKRSNKNSISTQPTININNQNTINNEIKCNRKRR